MQKNFLVSQTKKKLATESDKENFASEIRNEKLSSNKQKNFLVEKLASGRCKRTC